MTKHIGGLGHNIVHNPRDPAPDLEAVMKFVRESYDFTTKRYPRLRAPIDSDEVLAFAVGHVAKHIGENLGALLGQSGKFDHGEDLNHEMLRFTATKLFIDILELANVLGMKAEDLCDRAPEIIRRALKD